MAAKNVKTMKKASFKASGKSLNSQDLQGKIQKKAFEIFEKRGYAHGDDLADWFEAEKLVKKNRS
ncbi:MAG: DUF2934 domain-containing protein [Candidatus Omnitrophica bacterium]|nr:DUF2934 domain-containing protein [Candidatus Omnitrophota bacterium]MDD5356100.1 DUF2934 domain-containing protein [Candidatus Omnitrophota bacterium]